jgi:hypothetical protein
LNSPKIQRNYLPGYLGIIGLVGLSLAALTIHGYHVGVEDQAIYLPAILQHLHPSLFAHDAIFFEAQTRPMLTDELIAGLVRVTHISVDWLLLLFHLLSIFLLLLGAWRVARRCFASAHAVWAGLAFLTGLFLIPVAGTSQYILDQYLHPRALSTAFILFPVADFFPSVDPRPGIRRWIICSVCFALALVLQLQMAVFGLGLLLFLAIPWERWIRVLQPALLAFTPLSLLRQLFEPGSPAWQEAARTRSQHYLTRWEWYEWLGIIAPMFLFWWWARIAEKHAERSLGWFCRRLALYGALVFVLGSALILPPSFERLTPFQPMRMFTFIYLYMLLLGGGLLGRFLLRQAAWRWVTLFLPLAAGMYFAERALFPASPHIEWPGRTPRNDWAQAFLWIRTNTPDEAYFVLNPRYLGEDGEDNRGFRAWAWRGHLADWGKDAAVAGLFPDLAPQWQKQVHSLDNWSQLSGRDFARLKRDFGTDWALVEKKLPGGSLRQAPEGLECPYQNDSLYVCRIR